MNQQHNSLEAVYDDIRQCSRCALASGRTNYAIYDGTPQARLMLIGEAPGEQEDLQGSPFVGRAGQLLTQILQSVDIDRSTQTYICNVVKCRPPKNRPPTSEEAACCMNFLYRQIELVQPRIAVLLGATAVRYVLEIAEPRMTQIHAQHLSSERFPGVIFVPLYHPSYLLRNPSREPHKPKWQVWQAMKSIKQFLMTCDSPTGA